MIVWLMGWVPVSGIVERAGASMVPKIEFDKEKHVYKVNGVRTPSVTQIINQVVPKTFDPNNPFVIEARNRGAKIGTKVHSALEEWAQGNEPDPFDYPECEKHLESLENFINQNDPEFHDSEVWTCSVRHGYAGTLDVFCTFQKGKFKGASVRLDLKTGKSYPDSHWPQLEAYELGEVELGKPKSDFRMVLHTKAENKDGYRLVRSTDTANDFLVLLAHYRSVEGRNERRKRRK